MIPIPAYEVRATVHHGPRSVVTRAARKTDGASVVLKAPAATLPSPGELRRLHREFDIGRRLAEAGGMRYLALEPAGPSWVIVMEDLGADALERRLDRAPPPLDAWLEESVQIAALLGGLHALGYAHGDVKPGNLLVTPRGRLALCDFGHALPLDGASRFSTAVGTLTYIAPEQTGRTDRVVDHRADLYSLGVTLFHTLTGQPPFSSEDPLELLHAHLARAMPDAASRRADAPRQIDAILQRLTAKDPSDRYQSAAGVRHDLERCLAALRATGEVQSFPLGAGDVSDQLAMTDRVVGRAAQVDALVGALDRVAPGPARFVFLRGPGGIGKTTVVAELRPHLLARRGRQGSGKFEQMRRQVPYSAVFEALRGLLREVLSLPPARLEAWRARLSEALGGNGRLLMEPLPELARIVPDPPLLAEVSPLEEQARFAHAAQRFVVALAPPDEPLVLFLDDMQWADDATLRLLEGLAAVDDASLLIIGAYRDAEVSPGHPLALTIARLSATREPDWIDVGPLDAGAATELLALTLRRRDADVAALGAELAALTGGNPFFLRRMIDRLHRDGSITFDAASRTWHFDLARIRRAGVSDNVAEMMVAELDALEPRAARVMTFASVLGATFDLGTLAAVSGLPREELEDVLAAPLRRRLLVPGSDDETLRFAHDRVQEAAYGRLEEAERAPTHLTVGRILRGQDAGGDRLFDLVRHHNAGLAGVTDAEERAFVLDLNLRAAQVAKAANAWQAARELGEVARGLVGETPDDASYARWVAVHTLVAEAAYVLGDDVATDALLDRILAAARRPEDRTDAVRLRLLAYLARNELKRAITLAKEMVALAGVHLPARPTVAHIVAGLVKTRWRMRKHDAASLAALPPMTDANARMVMEVLSAVTTSTFMAEPELYPLISFELMRLTLHHGVCAESIEAFASYAMVLMAASGDLAAAERAMTVARAIPERAQAAHRWHRAALAEGLFIAPWTRPIRASIDLLFEAHGRGHEAGDTEFAMLAMSGACFHLLVGGEDLDDLDAHLVRHLDAICRTHHKHGEGDVRRQLQFVRNLRGLSADRVRMVSEEYDEEADHREQLAAGAKNSTSALAWYQGTLALTFRDLPRARERADAALADVASHNGTIMGARIRFLHAIAHLQNGDTAGTRRALATLRRLAARAPGTFGPLADLVAAERARLAGDHAAAGGGYESAMAGAAEAAAVQDAALAAELAARYWYDRALPSVARGYLDHARHFYALWGARAKVTALDEEYGPGAAAVVPRGTLTSTSGGDSSNHMDLDAAIRASNAVASARTVEEVTRRVLRCLVEDAGAQRAVLLLVDRAGSLHVVAEHTAERGFAAVDRPAEGFDGLPERIVRYVHRMQTPVCLRDAAAAGDYTQDPYVLANRSRSVLCAPISLQGKAVGVFTLENQLSAGAFSPDRLDLVTMLASQAAVSIANAELYESLERRVRERTAELEVRNRFIRQTFGRYLSDEVVNRLLETPGGLAMGGEKRHVTVLMSDLRGFSVLCERLAPEQVVSLINKFLGEMTEVILAHEGTIEEFIGDAILAVFGAPVAAGDDAERAVACALAMQRAMVDVNAWNVTNGLPAVEMGIGLNTGVVVVGNIGSPRRTKYGVLGSVVNLASRVESYTVGGQVLVTDATLAAVTVPVRVDDVLRVSPKGATEPMTLHDVRAIAGRYAVALPSDAEPTGALGIAAPLQWWEMKGKDAAGDARAGELVGLTGKGARLRLGASPAALADLRLRFAGPGAPVADTFAKVLRAAESADGACTVRFTAISAETRAWLDAQRAAVGPEG